MAFQYFDKFQQNITLKHFHTKRTEGLQIGFWQSLVFGGTVNFATVLLFNTYFYVTTYTYVFLQSNNTNTSYLMNGSKIRKNYMYRG